MAVGGYHDDQAKIGDGEANSDRTIALRIDPETVISCR